MSEYRSPAAAEDKLIRDTLDDDWEKEVDYEVGLVDQLSSTPLSDDDDKFMDPSGQPQEDLEGYKEQHAAAIREVSFQRVQDSEFWYAPPKRGEDGNYVGPSGDEVVSYLFLLQEAWGHAFSSEQNSPVRGSTQERANSYLQEVTGMEGLTTDTVDEFLRIWGGHFGLTEEDVAWTKWDRDVLDEQNWLADIADNLRGPIGAYGQGSFEDQAGWKRDYKGLPPMMEEHPNFLDFDYWLGKPTSVANFILPTTETEALLMALMWHPTAYVTNKVINGVLTAGQSLQRSMLTKAVTGYTNRAASQTSLPREVVEEFLLHAGHKAQSVPTLTGLIQGKPTVAFNKTAQEILAERLALIPERSSPSVSAWINRIQRTKFPTAGGSFGRALEDFSTLFRQIVDDVGINMRPLPAAPTATAASTTKPSLSALTSGSSQPVRALPPGTTAAQELSEMYGYDVTKLTRERYIDPQTGVNVGQLVNWSFRPEELNGVELLTTPTQIIQTGVDEFGAPQFQKISLPEKILDKIEEGFVNDPDGLIKNYLLSASPEKIYNDLVDYGRMIIENPQNQIAVVVHVDDLDSILKHGFQSVHYGHEGASGAEQRTVIESAHGWAADAPVESRPASGFLIHGQQIERLTNNRILSTGSEDFINTSLSEEEKRLLFGFPYVAYGAPLENMKLGSQGLTEENAAVIILNPDVINRSLIMSGDALVDMSVSTPMVGATDDQIVNMLIGSHGQYGTGATTSVDKLVTALERISRADWPEYPTAGFEIYNAYGSPTQHIIGNLDKTVGSISRPMHWEVLIPDHFTPDEIASVHLPNRNPPYQQVLNQSQLQQRRNEGIWNEGSRSFFFPSDTEITPLLFKPSMFMKEQLYSMLNSADRSIMETYGVNAVPLHVHLKGDDFSIDEEATIARVMLWAQPMYDKFSQAVENLELRSQSASVIAESEQGNLLADLLTSESGVEELSGPEFAEILEMAPENLRLTFLDAQGQALVSVANLFHAHIMALTNHRKLHTKYRWEGTQGFENMPFYSPSYAPQARDYAATGPTFGDLERIIQVAEYAMNEVLRIGGLRSTTPEFEFFGEMLPAQEVGYNISAEGYAGLIQDMVKGAEVFGRFMKRWEEYIETQNLGSDLKYYRLDPDDGPFDPDDLIDGL